MRSFLFALIVFLVADSLPYCRAGRNDHSLVQTVEFPVPRGHHLFYGKGKGKSKDGKGSHSKRGSSKSSSKKSKKMSGKRMTVRSKSKSGKSKASNSASAPSSSAPVPSAPTSKTTAPVASTDSPVAATEAPATDRTTSAPVAAPGTDAPVTDPSTDAPMADPTTNAPVADPTTDAPVSEPTSEAPTTEAPVIATSEPTLAPMAATLDCSFQDDFDVAGDGSILMRRVINQDDQTVSVELEYAGEGWLGFAFSSEPVMVPNIAVIGLPEEGVVEKYSLQQRDPTGVTPIGQSTLTATSIVQANGVTTLAFTKPLADAGEPTVVVGENQFNWAHGSSNTLGFHERRGSVIAKFDECLEGGTPVPQCRPVPETGSDTSGCEVFASINCFLIVDGTEIQCVNLTPEDCEPGLMLALQYSAFSGPQEMIFGASLSKGSGTGFLDGGEPPELVGPEFGFSGDDTQFIGSCTTADPCQEFISITASGEIVGGGTCSATSTVILPFALE